VPTAVADLTEAILLAEVAKPVAAAVLGRPESVSILTPAGEATRKVRRMPVYGYPENAARALAHAADYREWRDAPRGTVPELADVDTEAARALVAGFLSANPDGGWLPGSAAAELVACYGIPVIAIEALASAQAAIAAAREVETIVGVVAEPVFGPLVVFGLGGVASDVLGDRAARLAPLTDADAAAMIGAVRAAPLLTGLAGGPAVDTGALAGLLLRVSRLADDLPQVAELDLNPVIARPDGAYPVDVRVRVAPAAPADPFLRQLR